MPVIALRGTDKLSRKGGDLDFMVPPKKAVNEKNIIDKVAQGKGWFIAGFNDIGYLAQILLIRPVPNGVDDAIKIDFFDGLRWYGVGSKLVDRRLFELLVPKHNGDPRLAGAVGFFQKVLSVGRISERDWLRVEAAGADEGFLAETAKALGLPITYQQIQAHGVSGLSKWRLRTASGGAVNTVSVISWLVCSMVALQLLGRLL